MSARGSARAAGALYGRRPRGAGPPRHGQRAGALELLKLTGGCDVNLIDELGVQLGDLLAAELIEQGFEGVLDFIMREDLAYREVFLLDRARDGPHALAAP